VDRLPGARGGDRVGKHRECGDKTQYRHQEEAHNAAYGLMRVTGGARPNNVYKCRYCGFWHTGRWNHIVFNAEAALPSAQHADTERPCEHCGCLFPETNHEALMGNLHAVVRQRDRLKAALRAAGVRAEMVEAIALNDGTKRPPPLSPEERAKRADGRDRGILNDE